ncbi:MAG: hypothetical protein AAF499_14875, partial [Pseudomonadota bacterium]
AHPYDGWWTAELQETPLRQYDGDWELTCNDVSGEFNFEIVESHVHVSLLGQLSERPLDGRGRFEVRQATNYEVSEAPSSDASLRDGAVTLIFKGDLRKQTPKGSLTHYIDEIGTGCRTAIRFNRSNPSSAGGS